MANELTISCSLSFQKGVMAPEALSLSSTQFNVAGTKFVKNIQSIPTSATAINISPLATAGWAVFKNLDATNYITLLTATAGTVFARLLPGEVAMFRFDTTVTAPAAQSNTAACLLEYEIVEI